MLRSSRLLHVCTSRLALYIMRNLIIALTCLMMVAGCVTHRITLTPEARAYEGTPDIEVEQQLEQVPHCGAQMLTVITMGVFPSWCERTFVISGKDSWTSPAEAHVTFVQGWVSLVLAPLPAWSFEGAGVENQIKQSILEED
ncbi:hypothetical protein S4A8_12654 [Salinisphaera sp. S4-8]|uniref:hypothetical protein n=1 Tax=Salinisphaera sp. S4-8 TaxID=633357 RepID=UPI00333E8ECD